MQLTALFATKNKGSTTATNKIHSLISLKSIYFSCLMIHISKENKHDNTKITKNKTMSTQTGIILKMITRCRRAFLNLILTPNPHSNIRENDRNTGNET
jgi:hypothetical protein